MPSNLQSRRRRWIVAIGKWLLVLFGAGALTHRACVRDATIRPAMTIRVVDSSGAPVAGAHVMIAHQTFPYGGIQDWWPIETGSDGTVSTTELTRTEHTAYLCMHGVTQHDFLACAGKEGRGVEAMRVKAGAVELRLHDDYRDDCSNLNTFNSAGGDLGWKLTAAVLGQTRQHMDRLPPEGHRGKTSSGE